jgi:CBS domain-containing protein
MIDDYLGAKVSDLKLPEVSKTCSPDTSLGDVLTTMKKAKIGSIIITDNNHPKGIFTERDLLMKVSGDDKSKLLDPIKKYMTKSPKFVYLHSDVREAMSLMRIGNFRHLVVVNNDKELVSVLSIKDVLNFLVDFTQSIRF